MRCRSAIGNVPIHPALKSSPLVSVVTPFYNTDSFIDEAIESILEQTYANYEYILVDNHSTDRSAEIAETYAKRDSRIRVLRTPRFFSQLDNISFAVQQIDNSSVYCKVLFADDWIFPHCLASMVTLGEAHPNTGVIAGYYLRGSSVSALGLDTRQSVYSGRDVCRRYFFEKLFPFGSPSTVAYRASVVRERTPLFEDGHLHEDTELIFRLMRRHDFGFVHQILSFMRVQEDSITYSARDFDPEALDRLIIVKKYGRDYLDQVEFDAVLGNAFWEFYRALAKQWVADRLGATSPGFWEYQYSGLETIGEKIRPTVLARYIARGALESLVHVGKASRRFSQKLGRSKHTG